MKRPNNFEKIKLKGYGVGTRQLVITDVYDPVEPPFYMSEGQRLWLGSAFTSNKGRVTILNITIAGRKSKDWTFAVVIDWKWASLTFITCKVADGSLATIPNGVGLGQMEKIRTEHILTPERFLNYIQQLTSARWDEITTAEKKDNKTK